jgi:formamidopyrimidine-DNA glycosylase
MPEGPEVRRHADALHDLLAGRRLVAVQARTKAAKAWLAEHQHAFAGRRVEWVRSHGKNLVALVEGGLYFYSHLMMWGRWELHPVAPPPETWDRRERARLIAEAGHPAAVLLSAPVFEVGETNGDPFAEHPYLASLGPDILPYPGAGPFAASCFVGRLCSPENREREVGAALLDQKVVAGIGNYLRAEMLFAAGVCPFRRVADLSSREVSDLCRIIPEIARRAYETGGVTVPPATRERMRADRTRFVYPNGSEEWGTRHWAFRRTNLACVVCGTPIKQKRQVTLSTDEGDKERVVYFCPVCQAQ